MVALIQCDQRPCRRRRAGTETHRGKRRRYRETPCRLRPGTALDRPKLDEGRGDSALQPSAGINVAETSISDFWPPGLRDNTFLLFEPPSLWYFVMAALGNQYFSYCLYCLTSFLTIFSSEVTRSNIFICVYMFFYVYIHIYLEL